MPSPSSCSSSPSKKSSLGTVGTAELFDLMRMGVLQENNPLLAAAQQIAAAATAAQQFAAAVQMMATTTSNPSANPSPHTTSMLTSPISSKKKTKRKLTAVEAGSTPIGQPYSPFPHTTSTTEVGTLKGKKKNKLTKGIKREIPTEELGKSRAAAAFWSSLGIKEEKQLDSKTHSVPAAAATQSLPRESELSERKRPAAIQELLQMKKQRRIVGSWGAGEETLDEAVKKEQANVDWPTFANRTLLYEENPGRCEMGPSNDDRESPIESNGVTSQLGEIISRMCDGHDKEDTETTASTNSQKSSHPDGEHGSGANGQNLPNGSYSTSSSRRKPAAVLRLKGVGEFNEKLENGEGGDGEDTSGEYHLFLSDDDLLSASSALPMDGLGGSAKSHNGVEGAQPQAGKSSKEPHTPSSTGHVVTTSASDNEGVTVSPLAALIPHDQPFALVPGRLSLLSNVVKYKMTVGEVKRRLMGPESFNFSLLGALLRRAKMPEKSQMLVDELAQVGLNIPRGRRRLSQVTLLSALTECESVQFAKDFQRIAEAEFPARQIADYSFRREFAGSSDIEGPYGQQRLSQRLQDLEITLQLAVEFVELLSQDRSPIMDTMPDAIFDHETQDPLCTFSMLTHGFGTPALLVGMQMFVAFLKHQIEAVQAQGDL